MAADEQRLKRYIRETLGMNNPIALDTFEEYVDEGLSVQDSLDATALRLGRASLASLEEEEEEEKKKKFPPSPLVNRQQRQQEFKDKAADIDKRNSEASDVIYYRLALMEEGSMCVVPAICAKCKSYTMVLEVGASGHGYGCVCKNCIDGLFASQRRETNTGLKY